MHNSVKEISVKSDNFAGTVVLLEKQHFTTQNTGPEPQYHWHCLHMESADRPETVGSHCWREAIHPWG